MAMSLVLLFLLCVSYTASAFIKENLPIFIFHGLNGSSYDLNTIVQNLTFDGRLAYSLNTFMHAPSRGDMWKQVAGYAQAVRQVIAQNPKQFQDGYHFMGYSQGGLTARAVAQIMDDHKIKRLISLAGPQNGIYISDYGDLLDYQMYLPDSLMRIMKKSMDRGNFIHNVLHRLMMRKGPDMSIASYWNNPMPTKKLSYLKRSAFLATLNNLNAVHPDSTIPDMTEYGLKSSPSTRKQNFIRVEEAHFFHSPGDNWITPDVSSVFGFYKFLNGRLQVVNMEELDIYQKDTFGLQTMMQEKRLHLKSVHGIPHQCWVRDDIGCKLHTTYENYVYPLIK